MSSNGNVLNGSQKSGENGLQMNRTVEGVAAAVYGLLRKTYVEVVRAGKFAGMEKEYGIFENKKLGGSSSGSGVEEHVRASVPDFIRVYKFVYSLFRRAQIEPECLIAGMVYLESFLSAGKNKGLILTGLNWERVVFTSLMVASKAWDDVSCSTKSFAICSNGSIGLSELCRMERIFLEHLDYRLYLTADTYRVVYYDLKKFWVNLVVDEKGVIAPGKWDFVASLEIPPQWGAEYVFGCADANSCAQLQTAPFSSASAGTNASTATTIRTTAPPTLSKGSQEDVRSDEVKAVGGVCHQTVAGHGHPGSCVASAGVMGTSVGVSVAVGEGVGVGVGVGAAGANGLKVSVKH
ncbi:putative Cyclin fold protein 1 [Monocercomonoides exilis]|uniref:putative Cyclin fold protein 1 n=1 Tax=Monocercomonoides exilis TaxID=2049356 RepID=UPI00355AC533|nr:putative Cyclin fold protein 1 [Monocercomonoides exilis]|eukprot:MONOS_4197.1-p1 / transcript=MONOS_4197.1 / gene=MONOS_4197 / organism=Monocercomonoides_exilis_PA203 / gene_product=Cyclin fold protein 1, putative / transcript_product=Cyclin fold protein 1, putative / location=Mono_scaffold00108:81337-82777(-) / protein_length=349 / sequence_SO=supercontig / SO=protein_coding / is_pseudo=false